MSSNMEVEGQQQPQQPTVAVHPLAIVHMSDQFTRVTCGGSPLPKTAPVIGLLFGINDMTAKNEIHIHDADDTIPLDDYSAEKQVELHQAVFPTHTTVGWYRVCSGSSNNSDQGPTLSDLQQTQRLRQKYPGQEILFGLLQVPNSSSSAASSGKDQKRKATPQGDAKEDDDNDEDDELPLTLYQVVGGGGQGEVLVAVEDWKIATSEAERIAVERVISEKPATSSSSSTATNTGASAAATNAASTGIVDPMAAIKVATEAAQEQSAFYQQTTHVQESWRAIQDRLAILVTFLESVQKQDASTLTLEEYYEQQLLLRQVQGLVRQLGPLAATCPTTSSAASKSTLSLPSPLQQLSVLAKTIDAATSYTDKFRLVQDHAGGPPSARELRRGFGM